MKKTAQITERPPDTPELLAAQGKTEKAIKVRAEALAAHEELRRRNQADDPLVQPMRAELRSAEEKFEAADHSLAIARAELKIARNEVQRQRHEYYLDRYKEVLAARDVAIKRLVFSEETAVRAMWSEAYGDGVELSVTPFIHFLQPWRDKTDEGGLWRHLGKCLRRDGYIPEDGDPDYE